MITSNGLVWVYLSPTQRKEFFYVPHCSFWIATRRILELKWKRIHRSGWKTEAETLSKMINVNKMRAHFSDEKLFRWNFMSVLLHEHPDVGSNNPATFKLLFSSNNNCIYSQSVTKADKPFCTIKHHLKVSIYIRNELGNKQRQKEWQQSLLELFFPSSCLFSIHNKISILANFKIGLRKT